MKSKLTLRLVLALLLFTCYSSLIAQTDSSWLDLGRIKLKKEFTQTVTIKGKDLEQTPFANLADAINVWLYGLASNKETLVYVIDGHLITDVNVYSIHDVEEITLVQNALIQLNGATKEKQLVLISTRKNRDKNAGINVAGSSFLVSNSFQDLSRDKQKGETNFYHQYYISAYQNRSKIQYGLSASYLRDVYPYPKEGYDIDQPYHVDRFRFNSYMNATIDAGNSVWLRAGYVPEKLGQEYTDNSTKQATNKFRGSYFTAEAGWQSRLFNKLTNELSAGFTPVTSRASITGLTAYPGPTGVVLRQYNSSAKTRTNNLLIDDHITYHASVGNWHIEPAVNFTYRYVKTKYTANSIVIDMPATTILSSGVTDDYKYNVFLITPALNVSYKNSFNIQGGFVYNLSKEQQSYSPKAKKWLPFATATIDVLKAFEPDRKTSWKIYGSYAAAGNFADDIFPLTEPTGFIEYPYPHDFNGVSDYRPYLYGGDSASYMVQTGTSVHLWNGRLQMGYSFEKRKCSDLITTVLLPSQMAVYTSMDIFNTIHRVGITAKVVEGTRVNWLMGLNASVVRTKVKVPNMSVLPGNFKNDVPLETGGWVNRFTYKQWMLGLDVLYAFNQRDYTGYNYGEDNAFSFRNIYAGYQLKWKHTPLDVYAECRNPGQKNESNLPDRREYYGLGFKAVL